MGPRNDSDPKFRKQAQAYWNALAPLYRKAKQLELEWDDYTEQKGRLTDLMAGAGPVAARTGDRRVVDAIYQLLSRETALYESTETLLLKQSAKILPSVSIRRLKASIYPRTVQAIAETIKSAETELRSLVPPPDDWPGVPAAEDSWLVPDSEIKTLESQEGEIEKRLRQTGDDIRRRAEEEQAEAKRKAQVEWQQRAERAKQEETLLDKEKEPSKGGQTRRDTT